jgi:hypothetical protein
VLKLADNYATHKHPKVRAWLARHPRFKMHFTPTSSSWLNLVERFFADLTAGRSKHPPKAASPGREAEHVRCPTDFLRAVLRERPVVQCQVQTLAAQQATWTGCLPDTDGTPGRNDVGVSDCAAGTGARFRCLDCVRVDRSSET